MTPCMPCSFGLLPYPRSGPCTLPNGAPGVTVTVRYVPLVTAACGTRVARTVRTTMLACGAMAPSLAGERGPSPGYHRVVGKSLEGLRQRVRDSNSGHRKVPAWWRPLVLAWDSFRSWLLMPAALPNLPASPYVAETRHHYCLIESGS
jgi:hypothetical protein